MNEMIFKILVELLSTLAVTTKEIKQGKLSESIVDEGIYYPTYEWRKTCSEACWREENGGDGPEAGPIDAGRGSANRSTDTQSRPWSCQEYEGGNGRWANPPSLLPLPAGCWGYFPVDGEVSVDHLKETLGMFFRPQSSGRVSDWASEIMHQVASDLNKAKREPVLMLWRLTGITEIVQQVAAFRRIFSGGYHHLIRGRTIMLPANHAMAGLQSGSFRETRFRNGEHPKSLVHFYGSMGKVC
jgi:hypothetical protein